MSLPDTTQPLERRRLSDQVLDLMLAAIRDGAYGPQDLITEPALAERLGISRTPVREALFRLVGNGVLQERGRGYCLPVLSEVEVGHMFHLRQLLEGDILRQIAQRLPPARGLAALEAAAQAELASTDLPVPAPFLAANTAFRQALFALCANRYLTAMADHCNDRLQAYRGATLSAPAARRGVATAHLALCAALRAGDMERAARRYLDQLDLARVAYAAASRDLAAQG